MMYQILLLEDGEPAQALLDLLDAQGESALWNKALRLQRPRQSLVKVIHDDFMGDEMRHRGFMTLCWNRRYGYVSLVRWVKPIQDTWQAKKSTKMHPRQS